MANPTKVRIAIESSRELEFEVDDASALVAALETGLADGTEIVWITDTKANRHGIRVASLAFVEIDDEGDHSGVGFGISD